MTPTMPASARSSAPRCKSSAQPISFSADRLIEAGFRAAGPGSANTSKTLRLSANLGRRTRRNSPDYVAMNVGATKTLFRAFALDLRYYQTDRGELGDIYRRRVVIAGRWTF